MQVPTLSDKDKRSWESIKSLEDEDLYTILGSEPTIHDEPSSTADFLLVGYGFEKTKETFAQGKRKLSQITEAIRDVACKRWESLKEQKIPLDKKTIIAIIAEAIKSVESGLPIPIIIPVAELICRICTYSLETFCKNRTGKKED